MKSVKELNELRSAMKQWRDDYLRIAFVPTMGNLHEGHLSLVKKAKELADKVVVSIYVNPMQFGANEDFDTYPRTLEADEKALLEAGADLLFLPTSQQMYPRTPENTTRVIVPGLSDILCGQFRPGHFTGVSTIVCKLLNLVQPDLLLLGQKDYQQVAVVRRMIEDLNLPVEVFPGATVRENDGLAMSSRNQYLNAEERQKAAMLYETLQESAVALRHEVSISEIEQQAKEKLSRYGFQCEYFTFRNAKTLDPVKIPEEPIVLLAAAYLGKTRLIDNLVITLH